MSIEQFVAECDRDQLETLIDKAKAALKRKNEEDFMPIWVITDGFLNEAAFEVDNYDAAVKKLSDIILQRVGSNRDIDYKLIKVKLRESEAKEMLAL